MSSEKILSAFFKNRPVFFVASTIYALFTLGYVLWITGNQFYTITNRDEILQLAQQTSSLQQRVFQSSPRLEKADKDVASLIENTGKNIVSATDEATRKAIFAELKQLNDTKAAIKSQLELIAYVSQALQHQKDVLIRFGGHPSQTGANLQGRLQKLVENALSSIAIRPSFADTASPSESATANLKSAIGGKEVPGWLRVLAQIIVTLIVSLFLAVLGIWSTRFIFSPPPANASNDQLKTHQDNQKFAQDIVKTLLSFSLGIITGLVAVK